MYSEPREIMTILDEMAVLIKQVVFTVANLTPPPEEEQRGKQTWVMQIEGENSWHEIEPDRAQKMQTGKQYVAICTFKNQRIEGIISVAEWLGKDGALQKIGEQMDISPLVWQFFLRSGFTMMR